MTIPQIQGWLKPFLCVGGAAICATLGAAYAHGELKTWEMLPDALAHASFEGFMALVIAVGAWLGLRSPLSAAAQSEKAAQKD